MKATTFLEIHDCLMNDKFLMQCSSGERIGLFNGLCSISWGVSTLAEEEGVFKYYFYPPVDKKGYQCPEKAEKEGYPVEKNTFGENRIHAYWADLNDEKGEEYNELRQNIILLCAAISGELDNLKE